VALVIALTAGLMGAAMFYNVRQHERLVMDTARADVAWQAKLVSRDMERLLQDTQSVLAGLVQHPAIRRRDPVTCNQLLERVRSAFPQYLNLSVTEGNRVLCSALPVGRSTTPPELDPSARQATGFMTGRFLLNPTNGKPSVGVALAKNGSGHQMVSAAAFLDLAWLNEQLEKSPAPNGCVVLILDRNGTVIARNPDADKWLGKPAF
jgi:hypothetical protein